MVECWRPSQKPLTRTLFPNSAGSGFARLDSRESLKRDFARDGVADDQLGISAAKLDTGGAESFRGRFVRLMNPIRQQPSLKTLG